MNPRNKQILTALLAGLLCGVGLLLSGMTDPSKVLAFLDLLGDWDPSLAFVMVGAIGVFAIAHAYSRRRSPVFGATFSRAPRARLDLPLVAGAALFGMGWGVSGYCPGPSVVALATLGPGIMLFFGCFLLGTRAARWLLESSRSRDSMTIDTESAR